ncbi:MAG: chitobiase/beta-hexosaminidase C-terminal domain-containing protein [Candidatus Cloacimonetes bacterium]|nr:chitobiase/beta-hexosaminidase C-terminal domain-containing protein [Candidatus Cloacimonadota bacterium]
MKKGLLFFLIILLCIIILLFVLFCRERVEPEPEPVLEPEIAQVVNPVLEPPGGTFTAPQLVSISTTTIDAEIRYTIDGSEPTRESELYSEPINIKTDKVIKARAFKEEWLESDIATGEYIITGTVAAPTIRPPAGTYNSVQNVVIRTATEGAVIRYTLDLTEPTMTSEQYVGPIRVESDICIRAIAFKEGWIESTITSACYQIVLQETVATPVFEVPEGIYTSEQYIRIICETEGATIRQTTDRTTPTVDAHEYVEPILITEDTTIKARAYKEDWIESAVATASYKITGIVAIPTFTPPAGLYAEEQIVVISSATENAVIRYTTDSTTPTANSVIYTEPVMIGEDMVIKARAFKDHWIESEVATAEYRISTAPEMVLIQGGDFNPASSYSVTLSPFYIGKYEITQAEYETVMNSNPSFHVNNANRPVEQISWFDAIEYCNRLSLQEGLTPVYKFGDHGIDPDNWPSNWKAVDTNHDLVNANWLANGYRLPTEMEWMFAAMGGNNSRGYSYSGSNNIEEVAWYRENAGAGLPGGNTNPDYGTKQVGLKNPNELGLYDMSGNVYEWVWDRYGEYPTGYRTNPTGRSSGDFRVRLGGSWAAYEEACSVEVRRRNLPTYSFFSYGFRVARNAE